MKIAIASEKKEINSKIDERFGRCNFFYIYDTETKKGDFYENSHKDGNQGVGTKIVEYLANQSVSEIFATEIGDKASEMLDKLNIKKNIVDKDNLIINIISKLN